MDSIHECGAQIELGPCGPKQVILVTESGSRLAEHWECGVGRSESAKGLVCAAPIRCAEMQGVRGAS